MRVVNNLRHHRRRAGSDVPNLACKDSAIRFEIAIGGQIQSILRMDEDSLLPGIVALLRHHGPFDGSIGVLDSF